MAESELILYRSDDGQVQIQLKAMNGSAWLNQLEIAELFAATKQNVSLHIKNVLEEGELDEAATVKESLTVQTEGKRQVKRKTLLYNLHMTLEQAELRARDRKQLTLDYWRQNVDRLLEFNERPVLNHAGKISNTDMKAIANERYETFDTNRRAVEALQADTEDLQVLEEIAKKGEKDD